MRKQLVTTTFSIALIATAFEQAVIGQTLLQGTLLDASCTGNAGGNVPNIPRGTPSPAATGAGSAGAYGSMGTSGSGSQAGMAGTNGSSATVRKTEKSLDLPRATAATATGAGTSAAYGTNGMAGTTDRISTAPTNSVSDAGSCTVGANSKAFAVKTGTGVILMDEASNRLIRRKLGTGTWKSGRSPEVTLMGKLSADRFSATSVKAKP